jgi:hypothetical protein
VAISAVVYSARLASRTAILAAMGSRLPMRLREESRRKAFWDFPYKAVIADQ